MLKTYTLTTNDAAQWRRIVPAALSVARSVEYVRIGEQWTGWTAWLFVVEDAGRPVVAYPYYLRPVEGHTVFDTCTPEYTGPFALNGGVTGFSELFAQHCREQGIVAEFAHLDPWIDHRLLELSCIHPDREIVYVDLQQSEEQLWTQSLTSDCRRMTKKARQSGVQVRRATTADDVRAFQRLYTETMDRRQAAARYYFSAEYFLAFHETLAANAFFVLAEFEGRPVAGGLFLHDATTVYWHLSAADREWCHVRPVNAYLYETICRSLGQNWKRMILGGAYEIGDGVFRFKASVSPRRAKFNTYQRVHDAATYGALVRAWHVRHAGAHTRQGFFPLYLQTALRVAGNSRA